VVGNGFSVVVATLLAVDFTTADFFAFLAFAQRAFAAAAQATATAKYRDPSPFDYAQGQDDDIKRLG
jgi:hypothetical protein